MEAEVPVCSLLACLCARAHLPCGFQHPEFQNGGVPFPDSPAKPQAPSSCRLSGLAPGRPPKAWRRGSEAKEAPSSLCVQQLPSCSPSSVFPRLDPSPEQRCPPPCPESPKTWGRVCACSCRLFSDPTYRIDGPWQMDKPWLH